MRRSFVSVFKPRGLRVSLLFFAVVLVFSSTLYWFLAGVLLSRKSVASTRRSVLPGAQTPAALRPQLVVSHSVQPFNGTLVLDWDTVTERLRIRRELHERIAPINAEFADDFGVELSQKQLRQRIDEMQSEQWLTASQPSELNSVTSKRLIAYGTSMGQTNNQLISFASMVKFAIFYNRTLVIPLPRKYLPLRYVGFEHGLWDLQRLSQIVDLVFETHIPSHIQSKYHAYKRLLFGREDPCRFDRRISDRIPRQYVEECEMIYITGGVSDLIQWLGPSLSVDVWKYILPAPYIRNAVELWLMNAVFNSPNAFDNVQFSNGSEIIGDAISNVSVALGTDDEVSEKRKLRWRRFVAVHRRAMDEFHKENNDNSDRFVCRRESKSIFTGEKHANLRADIGRVVRALAKAGLVKNKKRAKDRILEVYHYSCAMRLKDLNNVLALHRQKPVGDARDHPFFLAHDSQQPVVAEQMTRDGRGLQQSAHFQSNWSRVDAFRRLVNDTEYRRWLRTGDLCGKRLFCASASVIRNKETVLFDMWALYYADFFVGTWMSTLSANVCKWKSKRLSVAVSNECFLTEKWKATARAFPKGKQIDAAEVWFSLK